MIKPLLNSFRRNAQSPMTRGGVFTLCGFFCLAALGNAEAQTLHARISVVSVAPAKIRIDTEFPNATNVLSFRNAYGGVLGLGERIGMVEAIRADGESIESSTTGAGRIPNYRDVCTLQI